MFTVNDFYNFEEFTSCDKQHLEGMRQKKSNVMKGFNNLKIALIHDLLLYYQFLYNDSKEALADNPTQWVQGDFKKWKSQGRHPSTTSHTASQAGNTTMTSTAPVIVCVTKKAEEA